MPLLVVMIMLGPLSAVAQADDGVPAKRSSFTTAPMRIVGFNRSVASAHGYQIVSRNGTEVAIKRNAPGAAVQADGIVYGNCGYSYLYMSRGNNVYYILDSI